MRKVTVIATAAAAAAALAVANLAAATSTTKTETFTAITTNPGSGVASLIATGGFTAGGTDVIDKKHMETFHFANGKFTLVIGKPGSKHVSLNPTTCLYTKTGSGTYTLTDGTGAYQGISGSGKISFTLRAVYALVKGKCPSSDQPGGNVSTQTAIQYIQTARGPVSLP
jgi:hypothetical protein